MAGNRAQTPLDFAIAMGIFLVAVTFVFTFIPSLTTPFVEGDQDRSVAADRVASHLAEGGLGDPADPFVVDAECADDFFDGDANPDCGYSGGTFYERIGVDGSRLNANVTINQINPDASGDDRFRSVCHNDAVGVIHEDNGSFSCDTAFAAGDEPTDQDSVVVARRIVTIPGCDFDTASTEVNTCDATLEVRVW
jgi:hypothetical protein